MQINNRETADFELDTPINHTFHRQDSQRLQEWESTLPKEYWDYREQWEQNPKNRIVGKFPLHLDIEATSACNLECTMCPRTEMIQDGTFWKIQLFDIEVYKKLIDEGVQNGLKSLKYNYLGEPTLNKNLVDMIRYAKKAGVIDVMFNTNATMLDEKLSRQLIASGLNKLFFSFDSPREEKYNSIRINAEYHSVLDNIKRFHRIRSEMDTIYPFTRVSMIANANNEDERIEFQELFEPIVDAVAFIDYMAHNNRPDTDNELNHLSFNPEKKFCCHYLWQRMFIHPDGVVTPCCLDATRTLKVGNIFEESATEIWHGKKYNHLRELHASGRHKEIRTCAVCPYAQKID